MRNQLLCAGVLIACTGGAVAQEPAPAPLSKEFFKSRRKLLMDATGEGVILLRGAPKPADMSVFYQDHEFYYLTGVSEPDIAMLLFPETGKEMLLVQPFSRFTATWDGARLAPGERSAELTGFDEVGNARGMMRSLDDALAPDADGKRPVLWTLLSPSPNRTATSASAAGAARAISRDPLDGRVSREEALRARLTERFPDLVIEDIGPILNGSRGGNAMRGVKTAAEIEQIAAATNCAVQGLAEAMKSTAVGMYEYQVAAVARYVFSRFGAGPDAYAAIVGAGPNGCVLHYSANSKQLEDGDLIVMDYGPTVNGYATDVTRTFPANGKFTDAQRKLVQDVLEVQAELIRRVRPGASLSQLSGICRRLLTEKGYRTDHGPCHHVGLAVHDRGPDRLEPGMLITVEPGAYLRDEGMGCRIEDVVLVTDDGNRVLSAALPADPDGIERLMAQPGVAQVPVGLTSGHKDKKSRR